MEIDAQKDLIRLSIDEARACGKESPLEYPISSGSMLLRLAMDSRDRLEDFDPSHFPHGPRKLHEAEANKRALGLVKGMISQLHAEPIIMEQVAQEMIDGIEQ